MKNSKVFKSILFICGVIFAGVGGAILLAPEAFHGANGLELGRNASLLSEIRAPGGALLASGVLVVLGAFVPRIAFTSAVVSALLFLSYGTARVLSMALDGMPAVGLVQATILEISLGMMCVFALVKYREDRID